MVILVVSFSLPPVFTSSVPGKVFFMAMIRFLTRKQLASRPKQERLFHYESLERRMLLAADAVPDFQLLDVNPNSATFNTQVSPRDLLGQAGALYFVRST